MPGIETAFAATGKPTLAYIRGTYNGIATKVSTGSKVYILAVPNIMAASGTLAIADSSPADFMLHGASNSGVSFSPKVVFSSGSLPISDAERVAFASGIVAAYSGTVLASNSNIASFISASSSTGALASAGGNFVNTKLGGSAGVSIPAGTPAAAALKSEIAKAVASDKAASDYFGYSVGISADGNTAIVGAWQNDPGAVSNAGAAYVFVWSGTTWSEQQKLTASDKVATDYFGQSVAISSDGNAVIVGAYGADPGGLSSAGAAYVFVRSGTTWSEQQKLTASDKATSDFFGISVAISSDGNTSIVGSQYADPDAVANAGAAYVFVRSGTTWSEQQKLTASDKAGSDLFGQSVAISSDGNTAIVGAYNADPGGVLDAGAAYAFVWSGATWSEQQKLTASDKVATDYFGYSVSIMSDGNTAIVGAYFADPEGLSGAGAAYVFVRSGTTWSEQQKLTASDKAGSDLFGQSVAISSDGNTAIVGARYADPGAVANA